MSASCRSVRWARCARVALLAVTMGLVSACASAPNADARDPLEPFNRDVQRFNDGVDRAVVKPIATVYREVTPSFVRTLVGNFFGNLSDIWSTLNTALQLRPEDTAVNALRLGVNTFFGLGGLIDIASEMNLYSSPADFGQTLGTWGVPPGPYLVLPLLGPSTVRDTLGRGVESRGDRVMGVDHIPSRNSLYALRLVEARANLLRASDVLDEAALDKYTFTREVFLSRRQNAIDQQRRRDEP